ncbi:hypothetical protein B0H15DRAFT_360029 [Mycena belliarum]|uniref:DUF7924 domain-containing protein n=1 Tax=Mycena belliarum TaxID=1033014 RepID=A0AAD6XL57_9AGAR|nr:hypothetical protein B0H15DRAFT_360029 [Mycena belliae]
MSAALVFHHLRTVEDDKSASKLTLSDVTTLGWRILGEDSNSQANTCQNLWDFRSKDSSADTIVKSHTKLDAPKALLNHITSVRTRHMLITSLAPVQISSCYQLGKGPFVPAPDESQSDAELLKVCLHYVELSALHGTPIKWIDGRVAHPPGGLKETVVEIIYNDNPSVPEVLKKTRAKEAALVSLLRLGGPNLDTVKLHAISELTVERTVGSAISGIFYSADKVRVTSGQKLLIPKCLLPTNSVPYPDIAAVRIGDETKNGLEPVLIIGEGKTRKTGIQYNGEPNNNTPYARAQLAAGLHPTLVLLVLAYCKAKNIVDFTERNKKFPEFDKNYMAYGIYYDEKVIRIYTHFPQLEQNDSGPVVRFYQLEVECFSLEDTAFSERWAIASALLHVQKHTETVASTLSSVVNDYKF